MSKEPITPSAPISDGSAYVVPADEGYQVFLGMEKIGPWHTCPLAAQRWADSVADMDATEIMRQINANDPIFEGGE